MSRLSDRTVLAPRWVGLLPYFRSVHTGRVQTPTRPWSYSVVRLVLAVTCGGTPDVVPQLPSHRLMQVRDQRGEIVSVSEAVNRYVAQ